MIEVEHRGVVDVLHLRHGKANALDTAFCHAIAHAFEVLAQSPAKAAVIIGQGSIFSAGVDLVRVLEGGKAYIDTFMPALGKAFEAAFACPKPVVAAVNGHAIAGGCVLACAADRRLMAQGDGRIGVHFLGASKMSNAIDLIWEGVVSNATHLLAVAIVLLIGAAIYFVVGKRGRASGRWTSAFRSDEIDHKEEIAARQFGQFIVTKSKLSWSDFQNGEAVHRERTYRSLGWFKREILVAVYWCQNSGITDYGAYVLQYKPGGDGLSGKYIGTEGVNAAKLEAVDRYEWCRAHASSF